MRLYTDIDPFCCEVLRARVADGGLPPGEVWERDIKTLTAEELKPFTQIHLFAGIGGSPLGLKWAGWPDEWSIVTGGFPCQPVSVAGKGLAQKDDRWLWPEMHRVIDIVRPDWIVAENVPGLRTRGVDIVLGDLERSGYGAWALVVGADDVGAPHRRKRVWIVGMANAHPTRFDGQARHLLETCEVGGSPVQPRGSLGFRSLAGRGRSDFRWPSPPDVCRVDDGIPGWVDRLEALGNSQVPQVVEVIARAMIAARGSLTGAAADNAGGG